MNTKPNVGKKKKYCSVADLVAKKSQEAEQAEKSPEAGVLVGIEKGGEPTADGLGRDTYTTEQGAALVKREPYVRVSESWLLGAYTDPPSTISRPETAETKTFNQTAELKTEKERPERGLTVGGQTCLKIKNQKEICLIPLDDICYISQEQRKVIVYTTTGSHYVYAKISELDDYLDSRFKYILRFKVVNLTQIATIKDQKIIFKNGLELTLGRDNYAKARRIFLAYFSGK